MPETWQIKKAAVSSRGGVVVSQHQSASKVGAEILADGGNAVDAAVATGLALGCVEPWMSGIGGVGHMLVYRAEKHDCHAVGFGAKAPYAIDVDDYPLTGNLGADLFAWPAVQDDRNVMGPYSATVPSYVAGVSSALNTFGSMSWSDIMSPAIELAKAGLTADWFASLKIASAAKDLAKFNESSRVYLPDGFVPVGSWAGEPPTIKLGELVSTLRCLQDAGPDDFYQGDLAAKLTADFESVGMCLSLEDLKNYKTEISPVSPVKYREHEVFAAPGLTAGPSLLRTLANLQQKLSKVVSILPDENYFEAIVDSMQETYRFRFENMGDPPDAVDSSTNRGSSTTHINVIDKHGNAVSLTQTLLSVFGSRVMLPDTGILMNNGMMWFDPRPDMKNSIAPGKRPLTNMCPTIARSANGQLAAFGASGGRRIMSSVVQQLNFMLDYSMNADEVAHYPRVDVSGTDVVIVDDAMTEKIKSRLSKHYNIKVEPRKVYPNLFACPNVACGNPSDKYDDCFKTQGAAFVMSPWAAAVAEDI